MGETKRDGRSKTRLYRTYYSMLARCYNPHHVSYDLYGGRGIGVCQEWRDSYDCFAEWSLANGHDPSLPGKLNSIDRIDPDGDYSPENCRWITMTEQADNKQNSVTITYNGETHTISKWSHITGIDYYTLYNRYMTLHWSAEETLNTPTDAQCLKYTASDGREYTIEQIAAHAGIPHWLAYARLTQTDWTVDEIMNGKSRFDNYLTADGHVVSLHEIAEAAGVTRHTAWARINQMGWSPEKAMNTPQRRTEAFLSNGGSAYTVKEISDITGDNKTTIRSRLKTLGWSVDECLAGHRCNQDKAIVRE